jgi:hypothetical protein
MSSTSRAAGSGEPSPLAHHQPHKQGHHNHDCDAVDDIYQATKGLVPAVERSATFVLSRSSIAGFPPALLTPEPR